ncbi:nitrogenase component I subunit alpha [Methanothermococcus sp. SCGC AD-155-K20]|nr:nitrogenase component I subunit alpha [Methanothermococcus sp. SCGC AD-155-K20]
MPYILLDCDKFIPERMKHTYVYDPEENILPACNINTVPGDMTERGCAFAGSRGVVGGPIKDAIHMVHGPIGCAYYTWGTRRSLSDNELHRRYCFCSDMQESDIVYGGERTLEKACIEAMEEFPEANGTFIYTTCPTALIGDNVDAIAKNVEKNTKKPALAINSPGFCGVSQSKGHHVFNVTFYKWLKSKVNEYPEKCMSEEEKTPYDVALIGEYNMDWDINVIKPLLERIGCRYVSTFTGNASLDELFKLMDVKLNIVHCQRSAEYIAHMIKDGFDIPYTRATFFGLSDISKSLYDVAKALDLPKERVDQVVKEEMEIIKPKLEYYRSKLEGKTCMVYVGGPRTWHWIKAMKDLGVDYVVACCTFSHIDDYEKLNKNFKEVGIKDILVIDSPNEPELEEAVKTYNPDFMLIGLKERYLFRKYGIPTINSHSYEEGPYAGYRGFVNFARDIYKAVCHPIWDVLKEGENKFKNYKGDLNE